MREEPELLNKPLTAEQAAHPMFNPEPPPLNKTMPAEDRTPANNPRQRAPKLNRTVGPELLNRPLPNEVESEFGSLSNHADDTHREDG